MAVQAGRRRAGGERLEEFPSATPFNTLVVVPALNEEACIAHVVKGLAAQGLGWVRVVDNGSSDATATAAQVAGADVRYEPARGYGAACWTGIQDLPPGVEWVLFCGGDGQDVVGDVPALLEATAGGAADLVLGARTEGSPGGGGRNALSLPQVVGNGLACTLIWMGWGATYKDLGPLRVIRRGALEAMAMRDRGFGWTVEMQVRAVERGLRVREVGVHYRPRMAGESKISGTVRGVLLAGSVILTTLGALYLRQVAALGLPRAAPPGGNPDGAAVEDGEARQGPGGRWGRWLLVAGAWLILAGSADFPRHIDPSQPNTLPLFFRGAAILCSGYVMAVAAARGLGAAVGPALFWWVALQARIQVVLIQDPPAVRGDDIFRFIWEGAAQNRGINPYLHGPSSGGASAMRRDHWDLFRSINHPNTSAVYPPLAELAFRALAAASMDPMAFKAAFVAADVAVCVLLARRFGHARAVVYAWAPLGPVCFSSGGHHDPLMLLAQVAAWFSAEGGRPWLAAVLFGVAVGFKWVPLPLAAYLCVAVSEWRGAAVGVASALRCRFLGACSLPPPIGTVEGEAADSCVSRQVWPPADGPRGGSARTLALRSLSRSAAVLALTSLPLLCAVPFFCSRESGCVLTPGRTDGDEWARRARYSSLVPEVLGWLGVHWQNAAFVPPLAAGVLWLLWRAAAQPPPRTEGIALFAEDYYALLLVMSPVVHMWYFSWGLVFSVGTGRWAFPAAAVSTFLSFLRFLFPQLGGEIPGWATVLVWGPFLVGMFHSRRK